MQFCGLTWWWFCTTWCQVGALMMLLAARSWAGLPWFSLPWPPSPCGVASSRAVMWVVSPQHSTLDFLTVWQLGSQKRKGGGSREKARGALRGVSFQSCLPPTQGFAQGNCLRNHFRLSWKKECIMWVYGGSILIAYAVCPLPVFYFWEQKWAIYSFIGCHLLLPNIRWFVA